MSMPNARGAGTLLVTGCAGFIGYHVCRRLLAEGHRVAGLDCMTPYHPRILKERRIAELELEFGGGFTFEEADLLRLKDSEAFEGWRFDVVIHLAAQAGVRYSIENPWAYERSNIAGFLAVLEFCRRRGVKRLVYASSSSVYGGITTYPYSETMKVDKPVSLYAATKAANELMAHSYCSLYGLAAVGLRYFTVYGPWGRPDMLYWKVAESIRYGTVVPLYAGGTPKRDFTHVDDIVEGTVSASRIELDEGAHEVVNLGDNRPVAARRMVELLEELMGAKATLEERPFQPGDVVKTCADIGRARALLSYEPSIPLKEGLATFAAWYDSHRELTEEVARWRVNRERRKGGN